MSPLDAYRAEVAYAAVEERPFEGLVTNSIHEGLSPMVVFATRCKKLSPPLTT